MFLKRLELLNYRNYPYQQLEFSSGKNIIHGGNAQGKTNLLEAIYFLSYLKSGRARSVEEIVRAGENRMSVRGVIIDGRDRVDIRVAAGEGGWLVEVNGRRVGSLAGARGIFKCVLFSPDDLQMIKGGPQERRAFLDETTEGKGPVAAELLQRYRRVLRQRNAVLRRWEEYGGGLEAAIEPWTEKLASEGAEVVKNRIEICGRLAELAGGFFEEVSGGRAGACFAYSGTFDSGGESPEDIRSELFKAVRRSLENDKASRSTTVGPHRDDISITIDGKDARYFASQGDQRTLAFSMRAAQRVYLEETGGGRPVLLLDDVFSELDEKRRRKVLEVAAEGQAIITTTEIEEGFCSEGTRLFEVKDGNVTVERARDSGQGAGE